MPDERAGQKSSGRHERRVLFAAPTAKDATVTSAILSGARIDGLSCRDLQHLTAELEQGVGAILMTGEALTARGINGLLEALRQQPSWSEPPVVILMSGPAHAAPSAPVLAGLGNVTLLERPAPVRSVLSAVQAALRGRDRQYLIRDQLEEISHAEVAARELQQQLELAIDASALGTFHCKLPLGAMQWNDRCKALFWVDMKAEIDFPLFYSMLHPEDVERARSAVERCIDRAEVFETEFRAVSTAGEVRWIRATGRAYRDSNGAAMRLDGTMQDVTARKRTEEALRIADRRKDEFLAMLAHELRNPLAPIRNAVQIMRIREPNDEHIQKTSDMIARQVRHLARLVDDLLDVSRVTQGKVMLRREPIELTEVIHNGIELARPFIDAKRHQLTITLPPRGELHIRGDATRIAQVIGNLLDNAAKYSDEGGRIEIAVAREGDRVEISVRDNGVGIAADLLPRIFDLFTQAERSIDRAQGGLGIGLSLVKTMVELHGGKVEAASDGPGAGSKFTVSLPFISGEAKVENRLAEESMQKRPVPRRVLIVEDNVDSAESLRALLEIDGHEVCCAYDGARALEVVREFHPDVALLDIGLPTMDGFELARRLRSLPQTQAAVLIALTGYGQAEDRRRTKEAGFDHHLIKPVDPGLLANLVGGGQAGT